MPKGTQLLYTGLGYCSNRGLILLLPMLASAASAVHQPIYWADLGLTKGITLGWFTLRWYSLGYLVGILIAYWQLTRMIRLPGAPMALRHADDLFFWWTLGIILGGRLGYATFYGHQLWAHPLELFKLWEGGMSFHGGFLGVVVALAWVSWRNKLNFLRVADYISPCAPIGIGLVRLANFVNGELWGRVAGPDVSWAMVFPGAGPAARHPSQIYEALLEGLLLALVLIPIFWKTSARFRPGLMAGLFPLGYGLCRFVVEYFREPDSQLADFAVRTGMSMGQWLTVPMILVGLFFVIRAMRRPPLGA